MTIWKHGFSVELANAMGIDNAAAHLGIEVVDAGDDYLTGRMPVDARTRQPFGVLHGGASILFAETLGSIGANFVAGPDYVCFGQEVNGNHLRPATKGFVHGIAKPYHLGKKSQVWGIEISDDAGNLVCVARLTMAIVAKS